MASVEEKIENLTSEIIKNLGYDLYDVEYVKEGKDYFLRLYIESDKRNRLKWLWKSKWWNKWFIRSSRLY